MAELWDGKDWGWIWQRGCTHRPDLHLCTCTWGNACPQRGRGRWRAPCDARRLSARLLSARRLGAWEVHFVEHLRTNKSCEQHMEKESQRLPPFLQGGDQGGKCACAVPQDAVPGGKAQQCQDQGHDTTPLRRPCTSMSFKKPARSYGSSYCTCLLYKNSALKIGSAEPPSTFKRLSSG